MKKNKLSISQGNSLQNHNPLFILVFFILVAISLNGFAQETQYQTISATLKITAVKNGETYNLENKNVAVRLNYKNGDFLVRLKNTDFQQAANKHTTLQTNTNDNDEREYIFKGILPVNALINQKSINRAYPVELQLICDDLNINETLHFNMSVTRPGSGSYRIFSLSGTLYNEEVKIPAFNGYDNKVEMVLLFNAINNN